MNNPYIPTIFSIRKVIREIYNTVTIEIEGEERFLPGQFNMLYVFGVGEVPISISGDPTKPTIIHTIRDVGHVTHAITNLRKGDSIGVRGPFGNPWPINDYEGYDIVVIAGGLGLAPLRPLIYYLLANREKYGRIILRYGVKDPASFLYKRELMRWRGRFDLDLEVIVSKADERWKGKVGIVTSLFSTMDIDPSYTAAFICGPEIMMHFSARELLNLKIDASNIFISMERNMKCALGLCGHCQFGKEFICKDGPVFNYKRVERLLTIKEV
ncbi:MAG: FAD/NAD(P)-binding protein [Candidatus Nitrosocaldaceae archaeon]